MKPLKLFKLAIINCIVFRQFELHINELLNSSITLHPLLFYAQNNI